MSDRRQRISSVLTKWTTMMNDNPIDPLNSSIETSHLDPLVGVTNLCLENPSASKVRLRKLLRQVEKEFETVLIENVALRKELERYTTTNPTTHVSTTSKLRAANILPMIRNRVVLRTGNQSDELVFSSTNQHRDVIWDVQTGGLDDRYIGSASADKTAIIWSRKTGRSLINYQGHRGSVNSCRFGHFDHDLVLTASGDHDVHIWKWSQEENKDDGGGGDDEENESNTQIIRNPLLVLHGDEVISCADWLQRDQVVSASWDRSATLWQVETGSSLRTLYGHDGELTYVSCHQTKPLVITSSRDGTFRLWDCRTPSHSVQIFNGHTKAVNSALFISNDRLVSSSDDGFVHIWDSRSTSCSPLMSFECVSPCNRISFSHEILAVPLDNRDIRLYSTLNGDKIHVQRRAHTRAVQCATLVQCTNSMEYFLASGSLDRHMNVWHIKKLKGFNTNTTNTNNNNNNNINNKMKSFDESIISNIELNKNSNTTEKKIIKRTPLTEKPNNVVATTDKKQTTNTTADKQVQRTMSTTAK